MDLALNDLQRLIRHKTQQTKANQSVKRQTFIYIQLNDQTVLFLTIQSMFLHGYLISFMAI